ncbi:PREDICTED: LIRP-like [Bactrocera latifrons]|uniref:Insulin-related peptide n=1 Tax=Bactrocera latifrons TaxID=174628 RepID=A0A0K8TYC4_BACLA|nr:PREDICTED: LIRP-like [Bactrocera latifrons]
MISSALKIVTFLSLFIVGLQHISAQQAVCGPAIDAALSIMCENGFNTKFKKSLEWDGLANAEPEELSPFGMMNFPFLGRNHGGHVDTVAKTRRRREGVYDECCRKPCSYSELLSYCK